MRKTMKIMIMVVMMLTIVMSFLNAEKLKHDVNGTPIQLSRYFTCVKDTIPAQAPTVADSIAVPSNAAEAIIVGRHQALYVRYGVTNSTDYANAALWVYVPKDVVYRLPVMDCEYIAYKSATGAASINITWLRM